MPFSLTREILCEKVGHRTQTEKTKQALKEIADLNSAMLKEAFVAKRYPYTRAGLRMP